MNSVNHKNSSFSESFLSRLRQKIVDPFLLSEHPPRHDARGAALGLLVGFGFPLGLQWVSLGLIRTVFRFNFLLALALTWVNNPFTVGPMYYGFYLMGSALIGNPSEINSDTFLELMAPLFKAETFPDSLSGLAEIGSEILIKWAIGASITGLLFGTVGYVATYYIQSQRQQKRQKLSDSN